MANSKVAESSQGVYYRGLSRVLLCIGHTSRTYPSLISSLLCLHFLPAYLICGHYYFRILQILTDSFEICHRLESAARAEPSRLSGIAESVLWRLPSYLSCRRFSPPAPAYRPLLLLFLIFNCLPLTHNLNTGGCQNPFRSFDPQSLHSLENDTG